jgi:hypothetical protein
MAQLTDKRRFNAVSSLATPDAHGASHHERETKPIGRRYRSIPSYAEEGLSAKPAAGLSHGTFMERVNGGRQLNHLRYSWIKPTS